MFDDDQNHHEGDRYRIMFRAPGYAPSAWFSCGEHSMPEAAKSALMRIVHFGMGPLAKPRSIWCVLHLRGVGKNEIAVCVIARVTKTGSGLVNEIGRVASTLKAA